MAKTKEIRIKGISPKLHEELKNISKNLNVDMSSLIKPKLRELADSYPENYKVYRD